MRVVATSSVSPLYVPPPVLLSFPTRRSSDLAASFMLTSDIPGAAERALVARGAPLDATMLKVAHHGARDSRDRKSTRLNSSHRCISYAVFCLKIINHDIRSRLR